MLISSMNAADPATRATHPIFKLCDCSLDMLPSFLRCLDRFNPANPFIAREWRNVFPLCQCRFVVRKGLPQIRRQFVRHAP